MNFGFCAPNLTFGEYENCALTFTKTGNVLLSDAPLPAGNDFPTVVQIKTTPEAKPVYARFNLNTSICGECQNAEYACVCGH